MRTTIKDIAKATGLSIAAVSLVLNDKPNKISDKTKELILETAKELNYIPNQIARGLVNNTSDTIGLIIPDITNIHFASLAKSVENAMYDCGVNIMLCDSDNNQKREEEHIKMLYRNNITSVIIANAEDDEASNESFKLLERLNINVVLLDRGTVNFNFDCVGVNHEYGSYIATKHLIEMGHREIGVITAQRDTETTIARLKGFNKACKEFGLEVNEKYIFEGDYTIKSGELGARELIKQGVSVIYAFNDMMAYGVCKVASQMKLKIPEELSVIGFDNLQFSELLQVPLTTISQPIEEMGKRAVQLILDKLEKKTSQTQTYILNPELVVRESVGRCKRT